jgi:hypothetical protein
MDVMGELKFIRKQLLVRYSANGTGMCGAFVNHSGVLRKKKSENADSHALWACIRCGVVPITHHMTVRRKNPNHPPESVLVQHTVK